MQGIATLSETEKATQDYLDWLMDGEPLTSEAERELHEPRPVVEVDLDPTLSVWAPLLAA